MVPQTKPDWSECLLLLVYIRFHPSPTHPPQVVRVSLFPLPSCITQQSHTNTHQHTHKLTQRPKHQGWMPLWATVTFVEKLEKPTEKRTVPLGTSSAFFMLLVFIPAHSITPLPTQRVERSLCECESLMLCVSVGGSRFYAVPCFICCTPFMRSGCLYECQSFVCVWL